MAYMPTVPGLTEDGLRQAAGTRSFERGAGYLGRVRGLAVSEATQVSATVRGTHDYDTCVLAGEGGLTGLCSCPQGQAGSFCKHCVAVGLAALGSAAGAASDAAALASRRARQAPAGATADWLRSLSRDELIAELCEVIEHDAQLRQHFQRRARSARANHGKSPGRQPGADVRSTG
jgi:uncharacterized Zn finger protein